MNKVDDWVHEVDGDDLDVGKAICVGVLSRHDIRALRLWVLDSN